MWKQSLGISRLLTLTAIAYGVAGLALISGIALFFRRDYDRNRSASPEMINNLATVGD